MNYIIGLGIIFSYLIGAFPTAIWLGEAYYSIDVRKYGSGNAGATNVFRVLGKKAGIAVMLVDMAKGFTAINLAAILFITGTIPQHDLVLFKIIFGAAAVAGHIFPVYANFKGGKGIATLFGMLFSIHFQSIIICTVIFFIVVLISRYISLGSLISAILFPFILLILTGTEEPALIIFGFIVSLTVIFTHRKNIKRIIKGTENKSYLRF